MNSEHLEETMKRQRFSYASSLCDSYSFTGGLNYQPLKIDKPAPQAQNIIFLKAMHPNQYRLCFKKK